MSLENELGVMYIASLLSIIDISLTYYILWYDMRLNPKRPYFTELNPLAALIMKITNNGPWGLLIGACVSQTLIWGVSMLTNDPIKIVALGNFFAGAILVAVWIHTYSIRQLYKVSKQRQAVKEVLG